MMHLVEDHSAVDPTYVEDFLLTYRTFLKTPLEVADKLHAWFNDATIRDKVRHNNSILNYQPEGWSCGLACVHAGSRSSVLHYRLNTLRSFWIHKHMVPVD